MKIKDKLIPLLMLIPILSSCNNNHVDVANKPSDANFSYWINQTIKEEEFNLACAEFLIEGDIIPHYLDVSYEFVIKDDGLEYLPKEYVCYLTYRNASNDYCISDIVITDPNITFYGLSLTSDRYDIYFKMRDLGFAFHGNILNIAEDKRPFVFDKDGYGFMFAENLIYICY